LIEPAKFSTTPCKEVNPEINITAAGFFLDASQVAGPVPMDLPIIMI